MRRRLLAAALLLAAGCHRTHARPQLTLVTTTTTQDSGLLDRLVPAAEKRLGTTIRVIAVGSGEALEMARRGEADVVLCHSPRAEEEVVASGDLIGRVPLMWNRFLIVGPAADPAKVAGAGGDPVEAFRRIREAKALFVSRGDQSGTHKKEQAIWAAAGLYPEAAHVKQTGQGQGETLEVADQLDGYALADSSTWSRMGATLPHLKVLLDDADHDAATISLVNPYHVMIENPEKHPAARSDLARSLVDWLQSPEAAAIIGSGGLFTVGSPAG